MAGVEGSSGSTITIRVQSSVEQGANLFASRVSRITVLILAFVNLSGIIFLLLVGDFVSDRVGINANFVQDVSAGLYANAKNVDLSLDETLFREEPPSSSSTPPGVIGVAAGASGTILAWPLLCVWY